MHLQNPKFVCSVDYLSTLTQLLIYDFDSRGDMHPALWGDAVGNSWRTTNDISDNWERCALVIAMYLVVGAVCIVVLDLNPLTFGEKKILQHGLKSRSE